MTNSEQVTPTGRGAAKDESHIQGRMGPFELAFFVVAAAGPLLVVAGFAPLAFMIGGIGAPGAQLVAGIVLLLFAVGLTRMALRIKNAGAFYSYIGQGLGRPVGGGAATLATAAYSVIAIGQLGAVGAFAKAPVKDAFGVDVPWPVFSLTALAIVVYLGHRQISLSAKVLGVALLSEAVVLLVLAAPVLWQGGAEGLDLDSFSPSSVFAGGSTGAMFAIVFGAFIGFESTAIYSEEARDPKRTVPRAVYLAVGFLALFYTFMAWIVYVAYGKASIVDAATADPVGLVFAATEKYVGHGAVVVMEVLLVTSAFASTLAFHNTASRYLFTLGREKMLPSALARVHPGHRSPYVASAVQGIIGLVAIIAFAIAGADPYLQVFLLMVAPGVLAVIVLQAVCSLAIAVYFNRRDTAHGLTVWSTTVAPVLSLVGLGVASWLVARNFELLSGRTDWVNVLLLSFIPLAFLIGTIRSLRLKRNQPEVYERLTKTEVF
ncbi:APC family permease [Actinomadura syzygii]|uniref:APC family permease n=1 Tax=Actinomadura syzygii TaxID=1427538 RepID=A0A5D0U9C8_9ACTN|nr:APC family permease [Actinomadura syzygii]TYC14370.1 APC family permease [Actinomadura syzygii]